MVLALSLLALTLSAAPATPPSGRALNTQGFRLYQSGRYPEALEKFQAAAQATPDYALAHYNAAATLGVLRKQGKVCEYSAHRDVILEKLTTAVRLDARRLQRAKTDRDLDGIRDTLGWQKLLGRTPQKEADVPALLRTVSWYGPGVGVYGTTRALKFQDGGRVELWKRDVDDSGTPHESRTPGTYTVRGRTVEVKLPGAAPVTGTLSEAGALTFPEPLGGFTDSPSECDA
ncbi:tetratricopeptide repeat protein [Corallococcus carmarthensis]|uniref:Tetratricopeptide repeat protein n=1 Tax=Corallococcus carmarthensis TaxID=2316728 RepID=A0A3A8KBM5_9BACT|nr:tetratricopeptide repeat protein [Corallococcus carmarthensis]NOK22440.1 tetratricopeptide repeat protein [Corallococcus carmarthensis]RKH05390.1 tetratricopeptide repeat protein [Corallococcus carmarthensis]